VRNIISATYNDSARVLCEVVALLFDVNKAYVNELVYSLQ